MLQHFNRHSTQPFSRYLKWFIVTFILCLDFYLVWLMYLQGAFIFAILTLIVLSTGIYTFTSSKTYALRYIYPGLMGISVFILFPLICTLAISLTNYSGTNQLSYQRTLEVLSKQRYFSGEKYPFTLYSKPNNQWQIAISVQGNRFISNDFTLIAQPQQLPLNLNDTPSEISPVSIKTIIAKRSELQQLQLLLPNGNSLTMSSLRQFAQQSPRYSYNENNKELLNNETGKRYRANDKIGFFQHINDKGEFQTERLEPGYIVYSGWNNFIKIFTDEGIRKPFIQIFIWTIIFSTLTVLFTTLLGMILACVVQWEMLQGKGIYRLLLILPYAVPAFISILIFKGLFNQSFGEINLILHQLFGIRPEWFNSPFLAKVMILIVNTWLGYPYMMILCMGLLKAIPQDLYEASAMDGASTWQNFSKITMPLLIKPLTPLMIASFAFNFNNFVLIQLLTNGRPDIIGTSTPAGYTDLLVSYTYRIAFEGSGRQDFGLAAAIATIIFLLVGGLALLNLRVSKLKLD
ncbi:maltose ABC transporter permease MalF [Mergibacter septicus]|uniref:maltose ABC transporter permease MalF n=1 Tax=Mergibacter septicus TaxID=221402 RepID=UPI0011790E8F|nr:maltose ABC transporter permease MalF [Mergibacter septicus]AWX13762.1 maltose ABC transporter permease MalF [Mergibacter septicus]